MLLVGHPKRIVLVCQKGQVEKHTTRRNVMKLGTYVKVVMEHNGNFVTLAKGFLKVYGQGKCVVGKKEFALNAIALEKIEEDANDYAVASFPRIEPIKFHKKKGGKVHFNKNSVWDSTRFCRDGKIA